MIVNSWAGGALDFHAIEPAELMAASDQLSVWVVRPTEVAVALGSAQRALLRTTQAPDGPARPSTISVGVRRSGGGAVLIDPGRSTWIDVLLPRTHRFWDDDVVRSSLTIGALLGRAFARSTGNRGAVAQSSGMDALGEQVCFAGLGPGEVTADGRKVIGISQRRVRAGARFQIMWYSEHRTELLLQGLDGLATAKKLFMPGRPGDEIRVEIDQRLGTIDDPSDILLDCVLAELGQFDRGERLRD